jgi:hypothetical protein
LHPYFTNMTLGADVSVKLRVAVGWTSKVLRTSVA